VDASKSNKIWKKILKEFEPPEMDISINEELASFVEKRKSEGGVKTDF
jgi:trimethylamine--corrinoid protein Co-methyltransferase